MENKDNQPEFDFDQESFKKLKRVFGPFGKEGKKKTDREIFFEWYEKYKKEEEEDTPPW